MALPEKHYIEQLSHYLMKGKLNSFERMVDRLEDEGISIDLTRIPNVTQKISNLFIGHLYPLNIDEIFIVLKFANDFQLFRKILKKFLFPISQRDQEFIIANLESLFGNLSEGFLYFIENFLPTTLANFLINSNLLADLSIIGINSENPLDDLNDIYSYIDLNYTNYGLRTHKIGTFKQYIKNYKKHREKFDKNYFIFETQKSDLFNLRTSSSSRIILFDFGTSNEKHLINAPLLEKIVKKFEHGEYKYEYPIVSMVIHGGIGPEGKGFTYLTPTAEIIEVCSDVKQSKAYVIEYKKYLKSIFLKKLANHMQTWNTSDKLKKETINFFNDNIHTKMVNYNEIEILLEQKILVYLQSKVKPFITREFLSFLNKSILDILLPVQMEDQFKVRMDLIKNNKLSETESVKMASLGDKSHYDVLNQRFFFLNLVNNIIQIIKTRDFP